jgi:uncharacterized membrane protein (DUF4010 family)
MHDTINNFLTPYIMGLLVATGIGLIIGLEREFDVDTKDKFAGIRTFPIISIFGCIVTFLSQALSPWILIVSFPGLLLFISIAYYAKSQKGDLGLTTSLTLLLAYILGIMSALHYIREALAATVLIITLLSLKTKLHAIVARITQEELFAFVKFTVLALLILPFLPDAKYGPNGLLNPRDIGFVVVIVSSLSFLGYLLIKFGSAEKGILLTAFLGGLFSSTAVTWVFSSKSKESPELSSHYGAGIVLASSVMFIRVTVVTFLFNKDILSVLWLPCVLMSITGSVAVYIIIRNSKKKIAKQEIQLGNPLNLLNALSFGLLFVGISFMVYYANVYLGTSGLYLSGLISGLTDVDAISISMSKFALATSKIDLSVNVIVIAILSNTIVKLFISVFKGSPQVKKKIAFSFGAIVLVGGTFILIKNLFQ